jgi:hypothetical protein
MDTVTTKPEHGTVEYYAVLLRGPADLNGRVLHLVEDLAVDPFHDRVSTDRLACIRSVLAAAELVRAELRAAGR